MLTLLYISVTVLKLLIPLTTQNITTKKMDHPQEPDITSRDDLIIFSEALSKSNHNIKNIKNLRRLHHDALKLKHHEGGPPFSTECTTSHGYVRTIDNSERMVEHRSQEKMKISMDGLSITMRRNSVTAGNRRKREQENAKIQARTLNVCNNITTRDVSVSFRKKEPRDNKYVQIQKKYNRGPLKDKYLSSWLNSLLLQACHNEKFDQTLQNCALTKYGLDQNSLRSKGIRPENLSRIYKCLFVYSIGFNDLLKQICGKNMNLRKTIWKVFAILLEYCAQGEFQTMIAEIQRDKLKKKQDLQKQIRSQQIIIQNFEQKNKEKYKKIEKQIQQLREQNHNLQNQNRELLQQFKQAEQAFNTEVSLRLKYQNRINEIHGVYCQIESKHARLLHDHQVDYTELLKLRALTADQGKAIIDLRKDNEHKMEELETLGKKLKYKMELVQQIQMKKYEDSNTNIGHVNNIKDLKMVIEEKNREIVQLGLAMANINVFLKNKTQECDDARKNLAISEEQNAKLHDTVDKQRLQLEELLADERDFGFKTSSIRGEIALLEVKLQQKCQQVKKLQVIVQKQQEISRRATTQAQAQKKLRAQVEEDLKICHTNIKDMKHAKNEIEQQNNERKRKMQTIDEIIEQKDQLINQQKLQIQTLSNDVSSLKLLTRTLESKLEITNQKMKADEEIFNKKIHTLKNDRDSFQKQYLEFDNVKKMLQLERDRFREQFQERDLGYKNEKFEKIQLQGFYDFSLKAGQQKNQQIKKLDIRISQMNQQISSTKRKLKSLEYTTQQKQKQLTKEKHSWMQRANLLSRQNKQRKLYIHPMVHEDVCENYRNRCEQLDRLRAATGKKIGELEEIVKARDGAISEMKQRHELETLEKVKKYQQILERKENEILYESNKNAHLKEKNKQLQTTLAKYTENGKQMSMERQQRYLTDIKQKKQQIDVLLKDLEKAHDANKAIRENYINYETLLPQKQKELVQLKQKLEEHKSQFVQVVEMKDRQLKEKIEEIEKLKEMEVGLEKKQARGNRSKQRNNNSNGKKNDMSLELREESGGGIDSKRNDFARKYKGAYIYYAK